jgi:polar amino acid transport system substrate-binding protein
MRCFGFLFCSSVIFTTLPAVAQEHFPLQILTEEFKPVHFMRDKVPQGFAVDLVNQIISRTPLDGRVEIIPWARAYKIALEEPNVLLFSTRRTKFREDKFKWASPVYIHNFLPTYELTLQQSNPVFICHHDANFKLENIEQAKQHTIAAQRGGYLTEYITQELSWPIEKIHYTRDYSDVIKLLQAGRVELAMIVSADYQTVLKIRGFDVAEFKPCLEFKKPPSYVYFSFSLSTEDKIVDIFKNELEQLYQNGTYQTLYQKWFSNIPNSEMNNE